MADQQVEQNHLQQNMVDGANGINGANGDGGHDQNHLQQNVVVGGNGFNAAAVAVLAAHAAAALAGLAGPVPNHFRNGANADHGHSHDQPYVENEQPQPSSSGVAAQPRPARTPGELALKALHLCWHAFDYLGRHFVLQPLCQQATDAVNEALSNAEQTVRWAHNLASETQPVRWYATVPISVLLMVLTTGEELATRYLDNDRPENQRLMIWLEGIHAKLEQLREQIYNHPAVRQVQGRPRPAPSCLNRDQQPELSRSSSASSLSDSEQHPPSISEAEPVRPETPDDSGLQFTADVAREPVQREEEGTEEGVERDNKVDVVDDKPQEMKAEEQPRASGADAAAASAGRPEPPVAAPATAAAAPAAAAAAESLLPAAEEAELAALSVGPQAQPQPEPQPPAQAASSEQLLAAEGSSQAEPETSRPAPKPASKGLLFLNLFGAKLM